MGTCAGRVSRHRIRVATEYLTLAVSGFRDEDGARCCTTLVIYLRDECRLFKAPSKHMRGWGPRLLAICTREPQGPDNSRSTGKARHRKTRVSSTPTGAESGPLKHLCWPPAWPAWCLGTLRKMSSHPHPIIDSEEYRGVGGRESEMCSHDVWVGEPIVSGRLDPA